MFEKINFLQNQYNNTPSNNKTPENTNTELNNKTSQSHKPSPLLPLNNSTSQLNKLIETDQEKSNSEQKEQEKPIIVQNKSKKLIESVANKLAIDLKNSESQNLNKNTYLNYLTLLNSNIEFH
jgi:hypothetical protein